MIRRTFKRTLTHISTARRLGIDWYLEGLNASCWSVLSRTTRRRRPKTIASHDLLFLLHLAYELCFLYAFFFFFFFLFLRQILCDQQQIILRFSYNVLKSFIFGVHFRYFMLIFFSLYSSICDLSLRIIGYVYGKYRLSIF